MKKCDSIPLTPERARSYAVSLLARREYSRKSLRDRLIDKGAPPEIADAVLDQLQQDGYQSDERFIASLVRVRIAQGKGPCVLYQEIKEHHIAKALLDAALHAESPDWFALAAEALNKRFDEKAQTFQEKGKQYRFLMMRGFEKEQIIAAL